MHIDPALCSQAPLFRDISPQDIPAMLRCLKAAHERHPRGSYIRLAGDPADFIGIVLSGTIHILQEGYDGRRSIISAFGPGAMFGEAFSCSEAP